MSRIILLFLVGLAWPGQGQFMNKYFGMVWDVNKPLSNTEFIKNISPLGLKITYREFVNQKFSIGVDLGFASYEDHLEPAIYVDGNTSTFAELYGYAFNTSLTLAGEYYFLTDKPVMPYVGFGLGAAYNKYTMYYNIFDNQDKVWGLMLRPSAGALISFGKNSPLGVITGLHYDYATTKSSDFDYENFSSLGIQVGLVFKLK